MLCSRAGGEIPVALLLLLALRTRPFQVPNNHWLYTSDCLCTEPEGSHHFRQLVRSVVATPNEFVELTGRYAQITGDPPVFACITQTQFRNLPPMPQPS